MRKVIARDGSRKIPLTQKREVGRVGCAELVLALALQRDVRVATRPV
jgi:hypothetical protein